jgi:hypothetical protein
MKVTAELIEKYHLGLCTEAEEAVVEKWLAEESISDIDKFSLDLSDEMKATCKEEMWTEISEVLPVSVQAKNKPAGGKYWSPSFVRSAAAVLALVLLSSVAVWWGQKNTFVQQVAVYHNDEKNVSEKFQAHGFNIELGPNSKANINASAYHQNGQIDFCGIIMINPLEDIELTLCTECRQRAVHREKVKFKKGETYIAVNYKFDTNSELIVVNERNIIDLPPVLQREIIKQFDI